MGGHEEHRHLPAGLQNEYQLEATHPVLDRWNCCFYLVNIAIHLIFDGREEGLLWLVK